MLSITDLFCSSVILTSSEKVKRTTFGTLPDVKDEQAALRAVLTVRQDVHRIDGDRVGICEAVLQSAPLTLEVPFYQVATHQMLFLMLGQQAAACDRQDDAVESRVIVFGD